MAHASTRSFSVCPAKRRPSKCHVIYSLFDEVYDVSQDAAHFEVRHAALLAEAQRIERDRIDPYGALGISHGH